MPRVAAVTEDAAAEGRAGCPSSRRTPSRTVTAATAPRAGGPGLAAYDAWTGRFAA
ncbi:hypothetical protein ABT382_24105 [Streptomyces pharetrae]|uniref:hypothetical protein n=1 Tax=Streptomyces pharetrae TaxID=291370 RepID=UPI00335744CA